MKRHLALVAASAAAFAAINSPAFAETAPDSTDVGVTGTALTFTSAPNLPSFGAATLDGSVQTLDAPLSAWEVKDPSGTAAGWNVTVESTPFREYDAAAGTPDYVAGGKQLDGGSLTIQRGTAGYDTAPSDQTLANAPVYSCVSACTLDNGSAARLVSADAANGMGIWASTGGVKATLKLGTRARSLPAGEVYRGEITWTLASGPGV
jgi:hypothetical protein